jgi:MFS family permease
LFFLFQGKAISAAEAFFGMGTMFGPSLGGALYEYGGFSLPFWISGIFPTYLAYLQTLVV